MFQVIEISEDGTPLRLSPPNDFEEAIKIMKQWLEDKGIDSNLVNDLDVSSFASSFLGPTDCISTSSNASTTPLLKGYSGPINAKPILFADAKFFISSRSS